ncbi:MAG TPA: nuclear transport factor 2 family protein [Patescibacteria group bacterium]|nr:nuclear transport factor 2 family protein [Patescibacteria group bacterium]
MDYHDALASARSAHPETPDEPTIAAALQRFSEFFGPLTEQSVRSGIPAAYAPTLWFNDTLKTVTERAQLEHYMTETARNVEHCRAVIDTWSLTREGDVLVRWHMVIRFKRFARGRDTESMGISLLRLDREGRIAFQQDFWNAADGLFQHVPVLGTMIRAIKRRV